MFVHVITVTQRDDDVRSIARSPAARLQPKHATASEYTRHSLQIHTSLPPNTHVTASKYTRHSIRIHTSQPPNTHVTASEYTRHSLQIHTFQPPNTHVTASKYTRHSLQIHTFQPPNTHVSACSKAATKARHSIRIHTFLPAARLQPKHATASEYTRLCLQQGCNQSTPQHPNTHVSACS